MENAKFAKYANHAILVCLFSLNRLHTLHGLLDGKKAEGKYSNYEKNGTILKTFYS